ncbi:MAG: carbon starvation protein A [Myxococcota bacterium]
MAAWTALLVLAFFVLGYRYWASHVGTRVFGEHPQLKTPAHTHYDGKDFVPTPRSILLGHHFTSIAGAAPIIGPCVAAYWGWIPALTWVVIGCVFIGGVHDYGALVVSAREEGRSIADIAGSVMNHRVRILFLCFVVVLVWLVLAVFSMAIAGLFTKNPSSVIPVNFEIGVAVAIGWLIHKRNTPAMIPSIVALILLYVSIGVGVLVPVSLTDFGVAEEAQQTTWILLLLAYSSAASLLPVWLLLQPRDYINSHQLFLGLALLFLGLFVSWPDFDAPAIRVGNDDAPPMVPILFVTIACGAISGFHGLVSSGTTSKQLTRMSDARSIGYGAMLGEGALALASTMAAVAGIGLVSECELPGGRHVENLSWGNYYDSWSHAGGYKAAAFVLGGAAFLESLGIPTQIARTLMAVLVISFAATSLDTATRIQRFIFAEMGKAIRVPLLQQRYFGTALAVVPAAVLALGETGAGTNPRAIGWVLWPIFGASNQMLAALVLLTLTLYFCRKNRPIAPLAIPAGIVTLAAASALLTKLHGFIQAGDWLLSLVAVGLLTMLVWIGVEGARSFRQIQLEKREAQLKDRAS